MTATNHALTGAVISLTIKQPWLSIPLAFLSHFLLDTIPHYNPPAITKYNFTNYASNWAKKMRLGSFRLIFTLDMILLVLALILVPYLGANSGASPFIIFVCMVAAICPDFIGGISYLLSLVRPPKQKNNRDWFTRFHVFLQWKEFPAGICIETAWFILALSAVIYLSRTRA